MNSVAIKRDSTISIIKGGGIILMVIGHSGCPKWLHDFIYMFHMPLFFICSGYFYKGCDNFSNIKTFIQKRLRGLYLPFIKWSLAFLLLHNIFRSINIYSPESTIYTNKEMLERLMYITLTMTRNEQLLGAFWFLKTLLLASCSVAIVDFLTSKISGLFKGWKMFYIMSLFMISSIIAKAFSLSLPVIGDLSIVCFGSTFYILGMLIKQHEVSLKFYQIAIVIIAVFIISQLLPCEMLTVPPKFMLVYFICAAISFIALYSLVKRFISNYSKLVYIGEHTMIILALHFLCFKPVSLIKILYFNLPIQNLSCFPVIYENNAIMWILYSILGISIPLLIEYAYIKLKRKLS